MRPSRRRLASAACTSGAFTQSCVGYLSDGLVFTVRTGFPGTFATYSDYQQLPVLGTGVSSSWAELSSMTNGVVDTIDSPYQFSVEMSGFFYAPVSGTYLFTGRSDDGNYLWLGVSAVDGTSFDNALLQV